MTDALPKTNKPKAAYIDWRNRPYATNAGTEEKRKQSERWAALNAFIRKHGGAVTSPPGKLLRIEVMKDSPLSEKLRELGYNVAQCGSVTRVTGAPSISPRTERLNPHRSEPVHRMRRSRNPSGRTLRCCPASV
jgi:hypothetical protein